MGQLPELARILSNGASAGLSMVSAYGVAVQELDDPAQTELQIALEEIRIGQPFERAMENLGQRLPSRELAVLVSTLAIQQRSGGDLVRALSDMASTLEARRETQREVKTLMAGATASSYVVMFIGAGRAVPGRPHAARARWTRWPAARSACSPWASPSSSSSSASCSSGKITRIDT